jgi:spermidine/putrescine transport system substrate-binding protein
MADLELDQLIARMDRARITRRGFLAASGLTGLSAFLAACSGGGGSTAASAAASSVGPGGTGTTEGKFYLYNWADYTDPGNIEAFKAQYGITEFTYDTFASNEEMLSTLQGGKVGIWDVSAPTADIVPSLIEGKFIQKIDWSKVPNAKYIGKDFKKQWWDPNDEYQLAKDWGTTGIGVRTKIVKEPVDSWKKFFELGPQYSGRIVVVNSLGDVLGPGLKALGYSLNTTDTTELEEMRQLLLKFAPHVLALNSDTYDAQLASEEVVLGLVWTGGLNDLKKEAETADTQYIIPSDGTLYWVDTFVILQDAPHPEAAHAFLNFMHDPQIQAIETETNQYATPNDEAKKYISAETLNDPTVFVPEAILNSGLLETTKDFSADQQRQDIWQEFSSKIGG